MIVCGPRNPKATQAQNPTVLFEILSPSSAIFDLGGKNAEYQTIPTLRRYVVLHQTQAAAEVFSRGDDGEWTYEFLDARGALDMPEVEICVPLSEIYDDVELAT